MQDFTHVLILLREKATNFSRISESSRSSQRLILLPKVILEDFCKGRHFTNWEGKIYSESKGFPGCSVVKNPPAMQQIWVPSLGWEDPLEKEMATHSSILAWRIPMDRGAWRAAVQGVTKEWLNNNKRSILQSGAGLVSDRSLGQPGYFFSTILCSNFPVPASLPLPLNGSWASGLTWARAIGWKVMREARLAGR